MAETDIAVVGMACRLPGAADLEAFWRMLHEGRDARRVLDDDHLRALGVPEEALADPDFVKAAMLLDDIDKFDAPFFGFSPRDAALFDPQHRVWLEVCWEAFEHAGHVPERFAGRVGVFAGCGMDTYLLHNILTNPDLVRNIGMFLVRHTGNDKDFLATRTSYQFDLRGPSINVVTACSTSLVAVHQAVQSLLAGECDMALAGGVTILVPQDRGYHFKEGEVLSPDGHCRSFDADSKGTIFGSGAGVVVLRRLADALADGDRIHAVIAASAINNDGARKVSYLAPSVDGYAECVAEALALADIPAENVQYIEAHGTGTSVGDPIEVEALTQAFRATTSRTGYCGIGSVKTNIGHLDTAAGIAGFLKVVLAMQHGELPASLNYRRPNPLIDFPKSPFYVTAERREWPRPAGGERIAGVSSLGVGGTNAHVLVRDAATQPAAPAVLYPRRCHLLPISGKGEAAAVGNATSMATWLRAYGDAELADVAWTVQHGRKPFSHRGFAVGDGATALADALAAPDWKAQLKRAADRAPSVVFLFPGGGAQYPGMARGLYEHEPVFRREADACLAALPEHRRAQVRALLFGDQTAPEHGEQLERPTLALPALFLVEYSLALTLMSFGIEPDALLGHSMGEYVAACLGGTMTLQQGMQIVLLRGELFEQAQQGAMLTVAMSADEVIALGEGDVSLAAANAPHLSVLAGAVATIDRLEAKLKTRNVDCQRVHIHVAAHSHLLDPILDRFREGLRAMTLQPAKKAWVSNVTGDWIDAQRAADADYWVEHLRRTVRFQDGVATLLAGGDRVFVEIGPGKALSSLVRMHERAAKSPALVSLPHPKDQKPADQFALEAVGRLWQLGVEVDWRALHGGVARRRVPLPTYAFQRQRHWIEPGARVAHEGVLRNEHETTPPTRLPNSEWLRQPVFRHQELPAGVTANPAATWLCLGDGELSRAMVAAAVAAGGKAAILGHAAAEGHEAAAWTAPLDDAAAIARALTQITAAVGTPTRVLFAESLAQHDATTLVTMLVATWQALGRADLTTGVRALGVISGAMRVAGEPITAPDRAAVAGFLRVVPREFDGVRARCVDVDAAVLAEPAGLAAALRREIEAADAPLCVARRGSGRHVLELAAGPEVAPVAASPWRERSVQIVTGGLGGIGMIVADHLARRAKARLVLVGRRGLPPRELWDEWLHQRDGDRQSDLIRRVREFESYGAEVEVVAADVADAAAMQRVVAVAKARFGGVHGVVHAAGVLDDGLIATRQRAQSERMLAPKLLGARALDAATATIPLDSFVVFGSTSGLAGIPGQCDYAAANAALDAFATWRSSKRSGRTLAVDWGPWQDAGMLTGAAAHSLPTPTWLGERAERDGAVEFAGTWSPATHWQLAEHRIRGGECVMPGTGLIELMVAAAQGALGDAQVRLERVELLTPLVFPGDAPRAVVVTVREVRDGHEVVVASAAPGHTASHDRTTHARAVARSFAGGEALLDVAAQRAACRTPAPPASDQARHVAFGARWQCIESVAIGDDAAFAGLRLPPAFAADLEQHRVHAALLDMAFGVGIRLLSRDAGDALFVPVGVEQVLVHGRMAERLVSCIKLRGHDPRTRLGTFDVTVATPSGIVLVEMIGLTVYGVRGSFGAVGEVAAGAAKSAPASAQSAAAVPHPVPRIEAILPRGITGPEGMAALELALASGAPQVVVSSMDVARVAAWLSLPPEKPRVVGNVDHGAGSGAGAGDADTPRDDVERKLAAAFHDLLGVERPGLDQDFFELGGHSLLAVRLFARVHKEFGLDLELATLLTAGTVRRLAVVVREQLQLPEPGSEPVRSVAARKGQHVVPIQVDGKRPKLFLVHGAGGNVLGFRELSHYFGKDQPLYGLQARGVDGKNPPHTSIADMARDYLAELREVQPHGPYFVGGYSGGGVIAYEMARLLRQVGEPVGLVMLIDSWCPQLQRRGKLARAMLHVGRLLRRGPMYPINILRQKAQRRAAARDQERARQQGGPLPQDLRGFEVQFAFENAFEQHRVGAYDGRVSLFRASEQGGGTRYVFDEQLGWGPFVNGGLSVVECPGNHFTMCTEPNVQVLCRHMMAAMDEVMAALPPA